MRESMNALRYAFAVSILAALTARVIPPAETAAGQIAGGDAGILVFDNVDNDFRNPPFNDTVLLFDREGKVKKRLPGLNTSQQIGGSRAVTASEDGRFFVVCENVAKRITAYLAKQEGRIILKFDNLRAIEDESLKQLLMKISRYHQRIELVASRGKKVIEDAIGDLPLDLMGEAGCLNLVFVHVEITCYAERLPGALDLAPHLTEQLQVCR